MDFTSSKEMFPFHDGSRHLRFASSFYAIRRCVSLLRRTEQAWRRRNGANIFQKQNSPEDQMPRSLLFYYYFSSSCPHGRDPETMQSNREHGWSGSATRQNFL